ncbi:MAG: hypothetical protein JO318_04345 [Chloroflexi bacterium]|nr:hypothetical protein [Chloroflexota bacterium]
MRWRIRSLLSDLGFARGYPNLAARQHPSTGLTPVDATSRYVILTSARGEPTVQHELIAEIPSAVSIAMLIAFVRGSGVQPALTIAG